MEYKSFGNRILKNVSAIFFFIVATVLIFTTAAVLFQIVAIGAVIGVSIWSIFKFVKFIKSKITQTQFGEETIVEVVPEMQDTFTHSIIDVDYEEIK